MKKKIILVSITTALALALLVGCSSEDETSQHGGPSIRNEKEILSDINNQIYDLFNRDDLHFEEIAIKKRLTDETNRTDTIDAGFTITVGGAEVECSGKVNYLLYNHGWDVESVELDYKNSVPLEAPVDLATNNINETTDYITKSGKLIDYGFDKDMLTASFSFNTVFEFDSVIVEGVTSVSYFFDRENFKWDSVQELTDETNVTPKESLNVEVSNYVSQKIGDNYELTDILYDDSTDSILYDYSGAVDYENCSKCIEYTVTVTNSSASGYLYEEFDYSSSILSVDWKDVSGTYSASYENSVWAGFDYNYCITFKSFTESEAIVDLTCENEDSYGDNHKFSSTDYSILLTEDYDHNYLSGEILLINSQDDQFELEIRIKDNTIELKVGSALSWITLIKAADENEV